MDKSAFQKRMECLLCIHPALTAAELAMPAEVLAAQRAALPLIEVEEIGTDAAFALLAGDGPGFINYSRLCKAWGVAAASACL
jgi:hypothetical protein